TLEKGHITLVNKLSDKNLNEREIALQECIISGMERIKFASIIYGVSKSKGKGMSYDKNKDKAQLIKTSDVSPSSNSQTSKVTCFVPAFDKDKSLNKSEPKMIESKFLKKVEPKIYGPNVMKSANVKIHSRKNIYKQKVWNEYRSFYRKKAQNKIIHVRTYQKGPIKVWVPKSQIGISSQRRNSGGSSSDGVEER
ncbi:hypothetical protein KIW84_021195, partial [Lathyrus oleraceus]